MARMSQDLPQPPPDVPIDRPAPRRAREAQTFYLFAYGTLTNPKVFRAVLGKDLVFTRAEADGRDRLLAREAVLAGYTKISPDNSYLYAVPDPQGRIRGFVIGPIELAGMRALKKYEGRNYKKIPVEVRTADEAVAAVAFVADLDQMRHAFGYEFRDRLKQEVLLREKIDRVLTEMDTAAGRPDRDVGRRALAELHGQTIRDLVRHHFEQHGISNFYIRTALEGEHLRDYTRVLADERICQYAPAYLSLVIRQVLFNQIEERVRTDFRYELDQMNISDRYYERTISALATLRLLNQHHHLLEILTGDALAEVHFDSQHHLIDFVRWAVATADALYEPAEGRRQLQFIHTHMGRGQVPLGAELEFSNIGHRVLADGAAGVDRVYDGFEYFSDFGLDILMWKLGGHVDNHRVKVSDRPKRGFLELALGNLSIRDEISKPITDDPWLLNQIIHETMRFYPVRPHSVHISLQMPQQDGHDADRPLPLAVLKCLFALLGDPRRCIDGQLRIMRLTGEEIVNRQPVPRMLMSSVARRRSAGSTGEDMPGVGGPGTLVQQFKFMRLSPAINYEPVAVALKGLQLRYQPGCFLTPTQYRDRPELRELFEALTAWAESPAPLSEAEVGGFLDAIHEGLMTERHGRPSHGRAYIGYCLDHLQGELERFNARAAQPSA